MGWDTGHARAWGSAAAALAAGVLAVGLASAPVESAAPVPAAQNFDTGFSLTSATVAPVYKYVAIRSCYAYTYNSSTRATYCYRYRLRTVYARFYGSIFQLKNRYGVWTRLPYTWSRAARAMVYNHYLDLLLHPVVTPPSPTPTLSPSAPSSPTGTPTPTATDVPTGTATPTVTPTVSVSPTATVTPTVSVPPTSASPTATTASPTPTITARTIPLPAGTGLSPTPTSTSAGEAPTKSSQYTYLSGTTAPLTSPRWDKCLPITWSIDLTNAAKAGTTAADELYRWQQTMDFASRVTGYTFQYVPGGDGRITIDQTTGNSVVSTAYAATGAKLLITYVSTTDSGAYRSTAVQNSTIGYTH
ncbi:MAG TPA: hypothetical protein VFL59_16250, partial [Candidatus Nanopelagicales bacterium]|nr:hypothetical protein [Candidatus Nanopelagicales bacterium]